MKMRLREKKPDVQAKLWQHDPEVFESAMEMYWSGLGGAAIARHFNIPDGTVYSWIHDFGSQRERIEPVDLPSLKLPAIKPLKERFRTAENADEWLDTLRENTLHEGESFEDMTITLVCGLLHGQSAKKLASVIYESLKEDPQSGKGYAFCNKGRNSIAVLSWKAPVYRISKYVKVHGTFIWPHEELGKTIEITKAEFDRLLLLEKYRKSSGTISQKTSINLDFMGVSCYT
jgi:transposase